MKKAFWAIAIFTLCTIAIGISLRLKNNPNEKPAIVPDISVGAVETIVEKTESSILFSEETETDYQVGFREGFHAFIDQTQTYIPSPSGAVVSYSSQVEDKVENEESKEQKTKGYIDGYHRATSLVHCPR